MSQPIRPLRSVLYMPGLNVRAHEKGRTLPADAIIIDLEDSVAPEAKDEARKAACDSIRAGGFAPRRVVLRVNATRTPWGEADLKAAVEARPDAILVSKIESAPDVARVGEAVRAAGAAPIEVWAMIETPRGILDIRDTVRHRDHDGPLAVLVLGTNDIAKDMRIPAGSGRTGLQPLLSLVVAAARAEGLDVIDGVYNDFSDVAGLEAECRAGRALGMDGKTLIHPNQIETVNRIFAPPEDEVAAAREIIAAFDLPENRGKGAINLGGRMVELLHAEAARRTVALAEAIKARRSEQA